MPSRKRVEGGYVLVVFAAVLLILLGFAALAVDTGVMYAAHTSAQRAADTAALAGAYAFVVAASDATNAALIADATERATNAAVSNTILRTQIASGELTPPVNVDVANRRVTVNLTHTISTFFARVLGQRFATVSVVAVAEAEAQANCSGCVKPWFIPNNALSTLGCGACDPSTEELLMRAGATTITTWAEGRVNTAFTIKPGNPSAALNPGDFFAIVLPNDSPGVNGGDAYRENIATCNTATSIQCGNQYYVKPGNMTGPTKQGTSLFISFNITDKPNELDPYRDFWGALMPDGRHYTGPSSPLPPALGGDKTTSHQIALAPIWDVCNTGVCPSGTLPGGSNALVTVIGYAKVFIDDVDNNGTVTAHLLDVAGCGLNPAPCGGSSVLGYPLRLVRMN
jgi:Flp pilus assembly protein TadG